MLDNTNNWNFLENLLGFNFNRNRRYIEQFRQYLPYQNQIWGVKQAVWIDTNHAYRHYLDIPELRAVIDKRASMMSAAKSTQTQQSMLAVEDAPGNAVE